MKCKQCGREFVDGEQAIVIGSEPYHARCAEDIESLAGTARMLRRFSFLSPQLASDLAGESISANPEHRFFAVTRTEDHEYDLHSFETQAEMEKYLIETELCCEGWFVDCIFVDGVRRNPLYKHTCTVTWEGRVANEA